MKVAKKNNHYTRLLLFIGIAVAAVLLMYFVSSPPPVEGALVSAGNRDTTIRIHKSKFFASKVKLDELKKTIDKNGMECTIKGDTVFVTSKKPITLDSIVKLFPLRGKEDGAEKKETKKKLVSPKPTKPNGKKDKDLL